jgi:hypothetical protein
MNDRCNGGLDGIRLLLIFFKAITDSCRQLLLCHFLLRSRQKRTVRPGCFGCMDALAAVAGQQKSQLL